MFLAAVGPCQAYSVLTHEAIVNSVWHTHIKPLLLERFPEATPEELREAYSYVYGGCLIQDLGYVPFSSRRYSDLVHYVRSGDFVAALIRESATLNEYAFALGALAHYASDHRGHPTINAATAIIYPKLQTKFGDSVTYEDSPPSHLKVEFSLDVVQVSRGLYAPDAFHGFIGFRVEKPLLERAFLDTYGIDLKDEFGTLDLAIETYRFSVGKLIPEMTKVAWQSKRTDIAKLSPGMTKKKFLYAMPRRRYEKEWGRTYHQPGPGARFMAVMFRLIPTFGPFKAFRFQPVPNKVENAFLQSFEETVEQYRVLLADVKTDRLNLKLTNYNLDTGKPTRAAEYRLADETYERLLDKLAERKFGDLNPALRADILSFFDQAAPGQVPEKARRQLESLRASEAATQ